MSDGISTATHGAVFEVTIDRPKANAIDLAASRRLNQAFAAFRDDPALRVAIVTGAGERFFSPGWDLKGAAGVEFLMTGRWMDAGEAKHWGLANHVVPKGQGLAKAREIAQQLIAGPPLLFPAIKQLLRHTEMVPEHAAFELHDSLDAVQKVIRSQDLKEGARAFAEKRKPVWKGK